MKKLLFVLLFIILVPFIVSADWCTNIGAEWVRPETGMDWCRCPDGQAASGASCPTGGTLREQNEASRFLSIKCSAKDITICNSDGSGCVTSASGGTVSPVQDSSGNWACPDGFESPLLGGSSGGTSSSDGGSSSSGGTVVSGEGAVSGNEGTKVVVPATKFDLATLINVPASGNIGDLLGRIATWLLNIALIIAPLVIIYGGYLHVSAAGEMAKINKARNVILFASIGFILALLAKGLVGIFIELVVK